MNLPASTLLHSRSLYWTLSLCVLTAKSPILGHNPYLGSTHEVVLRLKACPQAGPCRESRRACSLPYTAVPAGLDVSGPINGTSASVSDTSVEVLSHLLGVSVDHGIRPGDAVTASLCFTFTPTAVKCYITASVDTMQVSDSASNQQSALVRCQVCKITLTASARHRTYINKAQHGCQH